MHSHASVLLPITATHFPAAFNSAIRPETLCVAAAFTSVAQRGRATVVRRGPRAKAARGVRAVSIAMVIQFECAWLRTLLVDVRTARSTARV